MQALSWALTAAAILLALYAIRVTLQGRDPERPGQRAGLGCGFFFLACILWSLAARQWVGGWVDAFRLGLGAFLVTPALGALTRPQGGRLVLGVVGLVLGIVLAGPVVRELWTEARDAPRTRLETEIEELEEQEELLAARIDGWEEERIELEARLVTAGHEDFDSLQDDPDALADLERLAQVEELLALAHGRLEQVRRRIQEGEAALATAEERQEDALESLGLEGAATPTEEDLTPVEEYARRKRLEALYEELDE